MAALSKPRDQHFGRHTVSAGAFKRMVDTCENAPKASDELKAFVAAGVRILDKHK